MCVFEGTTVDRVGKHLSVRRLSEAAALWVLRHTSVHVALAATVEQPGIHTHTQPHCSGFHCHTHSSMCMCVCRSLKTPVKCSQCWWSRRWGRWCHLSQTALLWHWSVALATVVWMCCWIFIRRRLTSVEAWRQQCNHSSVCVCVCENLIKKDLCLLYTFICYTA